MGKNTQSFSDTIEEAIANFPNDKVEVLLNNDKVEIQIIRTDIDTYSVRAFGLEVATKKGKNDIKYVQRNLKKLRQIVNISEGIEPLERKNPESVSLGIDFEEQEKIRDQQEETKGQNPNEGQEEKDKEEKTTNKKKNKNTAINNEKRVRSSNINVEQETKRREKREQLSKQKGQERVEMNLTREVSSDETLKQFIFRTMKVNAGKVVRVRTGAHTYEYEIYDQTGKNVGKDLLTPKLEGKNPRTTIWVLNNDGHFVKKEVDSLLLTKNGLYGFATDRGNNTLGEVATSYQVTRLPGGEYVALQALEQQKRNREASSSMDVKALTRSGSSEHRMKGVIEAAKSAASVSTVKEDGLIDTREVKIIQLLKREGFNENEIECIFDEIYEGMIKENMTGSQVEQVVVSVRDLKSQGCPIKKIEEILQKNLEKSNGSDISEKTPGSDAMERREGRKRI